MEGGREIDSERERERVRGRERKEEGGGGGGGEMEWDRGETKTEQSNRSWIKNSKDSNDTVDNRQVS